MLEKASPQEGFLGGKLHPPFHFKLVSTRRRQFHLYRMKVSLSVSWIILCAATCALGADWPKGFVVQPYTQSADGRFGILVPDAQTYGDQGDDSDVPNYLVDISNHRIIGTIADGDYIHNENHRDLWADWNAASTLCVATYDGRFGFGDIQLLELHNDKFSQVELGAFIHNTLNGVIAREAGDPDAGCDVTCNVRFGEDGKIKFRAVGTTNAKRFEDQKTYGALFGGTYDPAANRWSDVVTRSLPTNLCDTFYDVYENPVTSPRINESGTDEQNAESLDSVLNDTYAALRFLLPPDQFAKIKAKQIRWLKKRDAITSLADRNKFVEARISTLQDLLW